MFPPETDRTFSVELSDHRVLDVTLEIRQRLELATLYAAPF